MELHLTRSITKDVLIPAGPVHLEGELTIPEDAEALVIFSHGSGSSRFSPRNRMVAKALQKKGIGTLLFDLLTAEEDSIHASRFDIDLLTKRLTAATGWLMEHEISDDLNIGYFGASTGAASALNAAADLPFIIKAVVCRGGRPDLSLPVLEMVKAPVLLIVGGLDSQVVEFNKLAYEKINCEKELKIVSGATHLFEESGKLDEVCILAAKWFKKYLLAQK